MKNRIKTLKTETTKIHREARTKTIGYILAGFSLVAGLAWNDAIKALITELFPSSTDNLLAKFGYAVLITIVIVIAGMYITKIFREEAE